MTVISTVIYPRSATSKFDMSYYISKHMPLVAETWGPFGLEAWYVQEHSVDASGKPSDYSVQAILHWKNLEQAKRATNPEFDEAKKVFGDVKEFTNEAPKFWWGEEMGRWKAS